MKLTRLRLHGFKSFVEPTDFHIEPGLTGVVGPNGCGKSNLVEALRWVMGETSHKSLRATDMDSVIFSGSGNRPSRNHAEVSMTIDNAQRTAPAAMNDQDVLEITRRIEREAGSNYRINGRDVRARDVQILFADAATGARSPALVHQGKIGEIIQAKPEQRRRVLEDAAGVAGLHARRHEAELRLKAAETNLTRVEDVVGQLTGQIDGLKRQARQAIRYREVAARVRKAEAMLFHLRWMQAHADVNESVQVHDLAVREMAERTRHQAEAARIQAIRASEMPHLREGEARAAAGLQRLTNARELLDREEERAKERITELDRRVAQLTADIAREQRQSSDADVALERLDAEDAVLKEEIKARVEKRSGADERVAEADATLAAAERTFAELTTALADLSAKRNQLEANVRTHQTRVARLDQEVASVEAEIARLAQETGAFGDVDALAAAIETAQQSLAAAEMASRESETAHVVARQTLEASRSPLVEADKRVQRLETEARTISKLLDGETKNLWPPIIDGVTVTKGYEKALGAVLGDDLDAPVDPSSPIRWTDIGVLEGDPALPEGAEPLAAHVSAPAELARRLAQIGIVAKERGAELAGRLKAGQRLVSLEGDVWRWDGFVTAAHAPTGAARRLAQRARLTEIETELEEARFDAAAKREALENAEQELKAAAFAETAARDAWRAAQREADATRERHAAAEREINRHAARKSALDEARTRLHSDREEAFASLESATISLEEMPASGEAEARLAAVRDDMEGHRRLAAQVRAEAQALAREAELADRRVQAIIAERTEWQSRKEGAGSQIETIETRIAEVSAERVELENAPEVFEQKRRALISEIELAEAARRTAADALAEAENMMAETDRAARLSLEALSSSRENTARAEERMEGARRRLDDTEREIRDVLEIEPQGVAAMAEITPETDLPPVAEIEGDLERLRRDRERLGAVNLRAEEELRDVETQHGALTTERDDLVEAIKRLRQGIQSLNKEARERLLGSFEIVNGHFKRLFTELFGGGEAALHLIESDDPLEAGLEIIAKPPGKKPQSLSLLSGGEQALTAMALIFAVFLTNPSPICVLDEVDAPLDDHNVERFCTLLQEMVSTTETRFIIITHNPITMARMNRLFGVTMAERGVSQLVSVDLEGAVEILDKNVA
ncbi:chromosome segregation protein SMC [Bradyrhizobium sp. U87765 SZCCT0131]|uniref:chromosome segregation protein SMC n=1 Tax=unclassified Bradyrhizobium TaxID=2631580 RepID=UPI001BA6E38D|nr:MULTISPECIES: chromosome segregation protein SMC [unclassified Bradyrhizobium]MBR1218161.1 chromosome segregation protein SMC [Bradyrhizobium sp. U87765 SZCCT0131]MBR1260893.1 chromosome segregation protein SMC [Bradyrhizobium sp. U87765 SZCCT0134]MBR1303659.1 chromosome segregation protein SMC [Bradyrhizobium sp. U87765 SZCCT0110]MBR1319265.1 chromosome segregation protein SMC [Bradyrhizobium sp. U87765 SZCCT0109]MBR1347590.1 chromosome segregation protein SMC [Bradyrhizobium sp. U87765 SZ